MANTASDSTTAKQEKMKHVSILTSIVTPPRTPTSVSTSAYQLLAEIQAIYDTISALSSLAPCDQVNTLLTRLVGLCIATHSSSFEAHFFSIPSVQELCEQLRPLCAAAEGELEAYWARKMLQQAESSGFHDSKSLLNSFPYYQNYIDLSRLEYATLSAFLPHPPVNIAFIGSGPLPLTSICMLDHCPTATIVNIDRDASALSVSRALCGRLGYGARMEFSCEDVSQTSASTWSDFDVVFLAALVGTDTCSKMDILASLLKKLKVGALLVARSAKGLRSVLYPVLELSGELEKIGLEVLVEVHPWTKVVNSVVVLRVLDVQKL